MRWMIQSVSLLVMLILGIFLGIDSAEKNMQKIQGTEGAPRAVQVTPTDGKVQIQVLGKDVILNKNDSLFEDPSSSPAPSTPTPAPESAKPKGQTSSPPPSKVNAATGSGSGLAQFGNELGGGLKTTTRKVLDFMFGWASNDGANQSEPHIQGSDSNTTLP